MPLGRTTKVFVLCFCMASWLVVWPGLMIALQKADSPTTAAWIQAIAAAVAIGAVVWQSLYQTRAARTAQRVAEQAREEEISRIRTSLVYRLTPVTTYVFNGTTTLLESGRFFTGDDADIFSLTGVIDIAFFDERDFNSNIHELGHEAAKEFAQMCFFLRNIKMTIPAMSLRVGNYIPPEKADETIVVYLTAVNQSAERLLKILSPLHE